jgi:hypothetical protein
MSDISAQFFQRISVPDLLPESAAKLDQIGRLMTLPVLLAEVSAEFVGGSLCHIFWRRSVPDLFAKVSAELVDSYGRHFRTSKSVSSSPLL